MIFWEVTDMGNRTALSIISLIHAINHIYQLILPVTIPKIALDYELSYFSVGLLVACFSFSYVIFQVPVGNLSKRFGRKLLMSFGLILNSSALFLIGVIFLYSFNIWLFAILLFIAGIGGSTYHPLGISFLVDKYPEKRGQTMGYHQTGGAIGSFISPLLIGAIVTTYGCKSAYLILSFLGMLFGPLLWFRLEDREYVLTTPLRNGKKSYQSALMLIFTSALYFVGFRGLNAFAIQYFNTDKIVTFSEATLLFSILQIAGIFSGPICGRLSDHFGRKQTIVSLIFLNTLSLFLMTIAQGVLLYFVCTLFGFTIFGLLATTDAYLSEITPEASLRTIFGLNLSIGFIVGTIIPPVLGNMIDNYGFTVSFTVMSVTSLLSILPLLGIRE
jgi:MFS family permease